MGMCRDRRKTQDEAITATRHGPDCFGFRCSAFQLHLGSVLVCSHVSLVCKLLHSERNEMSPDQLCNLISPELKQAHRHALLLTRVKTIDGGQAIAWLDGLMSGLTQASHALNEFKALVKEDKL